MSTCCELTINMQHGDAGVRNWLDYKDNRDSVHFVFKDLKNIKLTT
jgi:hypothetical protein